MMDFKFSAAYLAAILCANLGFSYLPMIALPGGQMLAPMSFVVGAVFVLRDLAQRELGHRVLLVMGVGLAASYIMADPFVAIASAIAFAISELADWFVYTLTKKPLAQRILISSVVGTPLDSAVFMLVAGFFSWPGLLIMTASKMAAALAVYAYYNRRNYA